MQSNHLAALLRPYKMLTSRHALSPTYRVIELSAGRIVGCSPAAILETRADHGIEEPTCVDSATFLAIVDSLPSGKELELSREDATLVWKCGAARGRIAIVSLPDALPTIPQGRPPAGAWAPPGVFIKATQLGGMSCDSHGTMSMGLYGIVIDRENGCIYSTDNITISIADFDAAGMDELFPPQMTFTPETLALLGAVVMPGKGKSWWDKQAMHYKDEFCSLFIKEVPALKGSALEMYCRFMDDTIKAKIPPEAIGAFVKRAGAMAESRRQTSISLGASEGRLQLIFSEGAAQADELFLVEEKVPDMAPVNLDGAKLARALGNVTTAVLDHMEKGIVVLTGPGFAYLIAGKRK